uniref:Uncharacterized protein n=1 Tax=Ananas comosus var. bracteatus TaxID=296719 RepID=A0A6V7P0G6_ANACO|nr:unnamed protein product [Ananas comosus var. bracteatus]
MRRAVHETTKQLQLQYKCSAHGTSSYTTSTAVGCKSNVNSEALIFRRLSAVPAGSVVAAGKKPGAARCGGASHLACMYLSFRHGAMCILLSFMHFFAAAHITFTALFSRSAFPTNTSGRLATSPLYSPLARAISNSARKLSSITTRTAAGPFFDSATTSTISGDRRHLDWQRALLNPAHRSRSATWRNEQLRQSLTVRFEHEQIRSSDRIVLTISSVAARIRFSAELELALRFPERFALGVVSDRPFSFALAVALGIRVSLDLLEEPHYQIREAPSAA